MRGVGSIAMVLLFAVGFVLYVGSAGEIQVGFIEFMNIIDQGASLSDLVNLVLSQLSDIVTAGTIAIAGAAAFMNSRSAGVAIGISILVGLVSIFLTPFTFYNEAGSMMPAELAMLVRGFFNMLIVLAVISFLSERDW